MVEHIKIENREQWLALRGKDMTASIIGAMVGVHDYTTPFAIFAEKTGKIKPDAEENEAMLRGRLLEPVAAQLVAMKHPDWRIEEPGIYLRDAEARIGATPDRFAYKPDGKKVNLQIKTVADIIFKKKWRDPITREIELPLWIAAQGITESVLGECDECYIALMVVGIGLDLHMIPVPIHMGLWKTLREKTAEFWRIIEAGGEIPVDFGRDHETIKRVYDDGGGPPIDVTGDNSFGAALAQRDKYKAIEKEAKGLIDEAETEIKSKMGNADAATFAGRVITWKLQHRKEYFAKASSFRVLRG